MKTLRLTIAALTAALLVALAIWLSIPPDAVAREQAGQPPAQSPPTAPATRPTRESLTEEEQRERLAQITVPFIVAAHGGRNWPLKSGVQADITVERDGNNILQGLMTAHAHSDRARIDLADGTKIGFDGQRFWTTSPEKVPVSEARQLLLTWPFLFTAPLRLQEKDHLATAYETRAFNGEQFDSLKINFRQELPGRSPHNWCMIYADQKTHYVHSIAYDLAENPPSETPGNFNAAVFDDYNIVDGVLLSNSWTLWDWNQDVVGKPVGRVTVSNVKFTRVALNAFMESFATPPATAPASNP